MTSADRPFRFSILEALARETTALREGVEVLTYRELDRWSSQVAEVCNRRGLGAEKPVGILAPASFEFAAALIGVWKAGAIAVPLQPAHPLAELQHIVSDSGLERVFFHPSCLELGESLRAETQIALEPVPLLASAGGLVEAAAPAVLPETGALIIYTSGTTNRPKGVVSTYASLNAQIVTLLTAWGWTSSDRTLNVLPLHHVHGLVNVLCCALAAGADCELAVRFDPQQAWDRIVSGDINVFMAVPTIYSRLAQQWEGQPQSVRAGWSEAAGKMRLMVSGSAALPQPLFERWQAITGHRLLERYGMTEIGMALSNPLRGERKVRTVGVPLPGVEVRLVDESGAVISGREIPGEIQVRAPTLFREYWRQPRATAESFAAENWFQTGDIAERDEDGYYRILGRRSQDIIKCGGYKISALEIESAILEHPLVVEAAVVGIPDVEWGERIAGFYVTSGEEGLRSDELAIWLKARIAHYKVPTRWRSCERLPRNAMGKLLKKELRAMAAADFTPPTS